MPPSTSGRMPDSTAGLVPARGIDDLRLPIADGGSKLNRKSRSGNSHGIESCSSSSSSSFSKNQPKLTMRMSLGMSLKSPIPIFRPALIAVGSGLRLRLGRCGDGDPAAGRPGWFADRLAPLVNQNRKFPGVQKKFKKVLTLIGESAKFVPHTV